MNDVKIVIGANYGDEGKGLATHYFSMKAKENGQTCLNVLYNGGSQRGHTVELKSGFRHVFHHFGSGTPDGAWTLIDSPFMVNPMTFASEYKELKANGYTPKTLVSDMCRVVTPYDMLLNQILEDSRGKDRHGSCGCGIYETEKRYKEEKGCLFYADMAQMSLFSIEEYLQELRDVWIPSKLKEYHIEDIPLCYSELLKSDGLIQHYLEDLCFMMRNSIHIDPIERNKLISWHDVIVFEAGQGLALDADNTKNYPHVTASNTTSWYPQELIYSINRNANVEVCYVTRSYFTRHGEGPFPTECHVEDINPDIIDVTNHPNPYQGTIRYGKFDICEILKRIAHDRSFVSGLCEKEPTRALFITHLNYTNNDLCTASGMGEYGLVEFSTCFGAKYLSNTKYAEDVLKV